LYNTFYYRVYCGCLIGLVAIGGGHMRVIAVILICFALLVTAAACGGNSGESPASEQQAVESSSGARITLPEPRRKGDVSVEEALDNRESRRRYGDEALDLSVIGQLLWCAGGLGADVVSGATRTAPSAGGIYPIELYLVTGETEGLEAGVYLYDALSHSLTSVSSGDVREELADAALSQGFISQAPVSMVIVADYGSSTGRYGERGERYAHMDAACASENVALQAEAMGLGTVVVGAFSDEAVADIINTEGITLIIMPIGVSQ
jgi:SagB-type dehydrogenase family enzyme